MRCTQAATRSGDDNNALITNSHRSTLETLEYGHVCLTTALAHGLKTVANLASLHFMKKRRH